MKGFKKLALASAVAALPMSGFAMEALQDEALSDVTGQDGLSISLTTDLSATLIIHDVDGIPTATQAGHNNAGAMVLTGFGINTAGSALTLGIDAGDSAANAAAPVLNIAVSIPNNTTISMGSLTVANSNRDGTAPAWGYSTTNQVTGVLDLGTVTLGTTTMNIQLGNEPQNDMIALNTSISGGLSISNFAINDANSNGGIGASSLTVLDTGGGANLTVDVGINATGSGLTVRLDQLGAGTGTTAGNGMDVRIVDQYLGTSGSVVGDIELVDLNLNGTTITISGK